MDKQFVKETCRIGEGKDCCRYLACGPDGFECLKHTSLKTQLDVRVLQNNISAQGDNCEGIKPNLEGRHENISVSGNVIQGKF